MRGRAASHRGRACHSPAVWGFHHGWLRPISDAKSPVVTQIPRGDGANEPPKRPRSTAFEERSTGLASSRRCLLGRSSHGPWAQNARRPSHIPLRSPHRFSPKAGETRDGRGSQPPLGCLNWWCTFAAASPQGAPLGPLDVRVPLVEELESARPNSRSPRKYPPVPSSTAPVQPRRVGPNMAPSVDP